MALFWKKEFVFIRRTVASCHLSLRQGVAVPFVEISPTSPVEANTTRFINERRGPDAHTPQDEVSGPNQPWKVPGPSCAAMRPRKRGRPTSWLSLLRWGAETSVEPNHREPALVNWLISQLFTWSSWTNRTGLTLPWHPFFTFCSPYFLLRRNCTNVFPSVSVFEFPGCSCKAIMIGKNEAETVNEVAMPL